MQIQKSQLCAKARAMLIGIALFASGLTAIYGTSSLTASLSMREALHPSAHEEATVVPIAAAAREQSDASVPLEKRTVRFTVFAGDTGPTSSGTIAVEAFPGWVEQYRTLLGETGRRISVASVRASIETGAILGMELKQDGRVFSVETDKKGVSRAQGDVIARAGYVFDLDDAALTVANALMNGETDVTIHAEYKTPVLTMQKEDGSFETLELLSTAYSDFSNSTPGRLHNVQKAIREKLQNVVVRKGEVYSHIAMLDAPITNKKGWMDDKGLFGGGVAVTTGAGICQSSTTLYRGVLLAGLPIVQARAHSLFVDHYEYYGIGLDATIFPGVQDFKFKNDTDSDIVIQSYITDETSKVTLQMFGKPTGRKVTMHGPYFAGSKNRPSSLRPLSKHQIVWVRKIEWPDGRVTEENRWSTYAKPIWNSMIKKYIGADGMQLLITRER